MPKPKLTEDQIREAAYHKWIEDGAPAGKDQEYWFKAEQDLARATPKKAPAKKAAAKKPAASKAAAKPAAAKKAPTKKAATARGKAKG